MISNSNKLILVRARYLLGVYTLLALTACDSSKTFVQPEAPLADPVSDVADLSGDILIAPTAPPLDIVYRNQSLTFSWQAPADISSVRLFSFNKATATEALISDNINPAENNYVMDINPKEVDLREWLYSVELCTETNCVSSYRTAVNTLPATAQIELADGDKNAVWQPSLDRSGNVLVALSRDTHSAEVHFKTGSGWIYANSLYPAGLTSNKQTTVDIAMSENGDTIAIAVYLPQDSEINISVFDRLGEAWVETSQWDTSFDAINDPAPQNLIAMNDNASQLLLLNQYGVTRYAREDLNYIETSTTASEANILTWDASPDLNQLVWLSQSAGEKITLTHSAYHNETYEQSLITDGMPLDSTIGATIQINSEGDEVLLAGWQTGEKLETLPSIWHAAITANSLSVLSVQSEPYLGAPSEQLIFSSSDDLQTSYLSWSDDAQMQIHVFQMNKQHLVQSFDLRSAMSLAEPAYQLAISGNGTSLSWASELVYTLEQRSNNNRKTVAMLD